MTDLQQGTSSTTDARRLEEASDWFVRLQSEPLGADELGRWEQWLALPANEQAFAKIEQLWSGTGGLAGMPLPSREAVARDRYDGAVPVRTWLDDRRGGSSAAPDIVRRYAWYATAAAAAVLLAVASLVIVQRSGAPAEQFRTYETRTAKHLEIPLLDGSRIALGARSSLSVFYSGSQRAVVLAGGEAMFEVAPDRDRPFVVVAGRGTITALGTAFNVDHGRDRVVVTVTEGVIEVARRPLAGEAGRQTNHPARVQAVRVAAGERVVYDADGRLGEVESADAEAATAWRSGRLRYRAESLKYVIADVNRYSYREIVVADPAIAELAFTGTVFQDQIDEWLAGLEAVFPVEAVPADDGRVRLQARQ